MCRSLLSGGAAATQLERWTHVIAPLRKHRTILYHCGAQRTTSPSPSAALPFLGEPIPGDVHALYYLDTRSDSTHRRPNGRAHHDSYALRTTWLNLKPIVAKRSAGANAVVAFGADVKQCRDGAHDRNETETRHGATAVGKYRRYGQRPPQVRSRQRYRLDILHAL